MAPEEDEIPFPAHGAGCLMQVRCKRKTIRAGQRIQLVKILIKTPLSLIGKDGF